MLVQVSRNILPGKGYKLFEWPDYYLVYRRKGMLVAAKFMQLPFNFLMGQIIWEGIHRILYKRKGTRW